MAEYRRPSRIYTPSLPAVFPLDLSQYIAKELEQGTFKGLTLETITVAQAPNRAREVQIPRGMRNFSKMTLKTPVAGLADIPDGSGLYLIGGFCVDAVAREHVGLVSDLTVALRYDLATHTLTGAVGLEGKELLPDSALLSDCLVQMGFAIQYEPLSST